MFNPYTETPSASIDDFGKFLRVEQFDDKKNQFLLHFEYGTILQSYNSLIIGSTSRSSFIYLGGIS